MDPYLGQIAMFAGTFAPAQWALCDGQLLSIAQNTALFSILGTTYGGDGVTTFALPDLRGRLPIHPGNGPGLTPYTPGENGGIENVTLIQTQMPAHNHMVNVNNAAGNVTDPTNALDAMINTGTVREPATTAMGYTSAPQTGTMAPTAVLPTGGNQPHANIQPFVCVNFIIALEGIYPSRN